MLMAVGWITSKVIHKRVQHFLLLICIFRILFSFQIWGIYLCPEKAHWNRSTPVLLSALNWYWSCSDICILTPWFGIPLNSCCKNRIGHASSIVPRLTSCLHVYFTARHVKLAAEWPLSFKMFSPLLEQCWGMHVSDNFF